MPDRGPEDPTGPLPTVRARRGSRAWIALLLVAGLLVAAVVVVEVVVARGSGSAGNALAAERIEPAAGGVQIRDATAEGPGPDTDSSAAAVLTDLNTFWSAALPADFGKRMTPLSGGYVAVDSSAAALTGGGGLCISVPDQIAGNAYYCPTADGIVYDSAGLVPVLLGHYGSAGLITAFAHEFGHAVQARIGPSASDRTAHAADYPSLVIEAQSDCDAGAFLAWVAAGSAPDLYLPRSSLVRAVAPLLDFADPVSISADDTAAHGLAVDRLSSLLLGLRSGPRACHALVRSSISPTLGRAGVAQPSDTPRYPSESAVLPAAKQSVTAFATTLTGLPSAPQALLRAVPVAADVAAGRPYGQFAVAAAQALAVGRHLTGSAGGAACFTGAWTASVFGHVPAGALGSWAGDADEALNMLRARPVATIDELIGFESGFSRGWGSCN